MRKILNISVVFLLLFSTSGVAMSKHFCGEILQKIAFSNEEKSCCEGEEMPEDCCKNEVTILKTENLKLAQNQINLTFTPFVLYFLESFINLNIEEHHQDLFYSNFNAPPPIGQDIFIQVKSFLL